MVVFFSNKLKVLVDYFSPHALQHRINPKKENKDTV